MTSHESRRSENLTKCGYFVIDSILHWDSKCARTPQMLANSVCIL